MMNKPAVALCLLLLPGLSMALDEVSDEEVRSKSAHSGNSFIVELFLKPDDEPHYSLNMTGHFPAIDQLLDISNGWYIYLLDEPVEGESNNIPTMRLLFVEGEDADTRLSFDVQALPLGAGSGLQKLMQKFRPRKAGHFHFDLQVSGSDVSVDRLKTKHYEAAKYIASGGQNAGCLQLYLPLVREAAAKPFVPSHPKLRKSHFKEKPDKWVEVMILNNREDIEQKQGWYSLSLARPGMDKADVEHDPLPESFVPAPGHSPRQIITHSSSYEVTFSDLQPSGVVYQHHTYVDPCTAIRARQSRLVGRVREGILTLILRRNRQTNFYNKEGKWTSRCQSTTESRFIQIHYQRGRIGQVTGDYSPYVKAITIRFGTEDAPVSVTLVMNSQQETDQQLQLEQQGLEVHPHVEVINAPPGMVLGNGIDEVDSPPLQHNELPVWMLNAGAVMMGAAAGAELTYNFVASPTAAGFF